MQLLCRRCQRLLEFSGDCPSFCGYCGNHLAADEAASAPTPAAAPQDDITLDAAAQSATAAHAPPTSRGAPAPAFPETVGVYRLLRQLGKGGMGSVFEAVDSSSGRHVALKLILPDFTASADAVERFRQEGRLASTIAHPRCVFVLAADEEAGQPYIVMELMPGSTLKDLVSAQGVLSPTAAITLILDVIDGLSEAHQHGVIHRDVKPSNCFLEADGRIKIGDFGLSKSLADDSHLTKTGAFLGTPLFASPEQVRGEPLDPRTDVYSVAATLYYLLVGRAPFEGGSAGSTMARLVSDPPPPLRGLRREIPAALDRVVLHGLERKRERRWQNLDEFRRALLPFVPGKLSFGGLGIRMGAILLDSLVTFPMSVIVGVLILWLNGGINLHPTAADTWLNTVLSMLPGLLYYTISEGLWGCSLGKWLLRLRVCSAGGQQAPGLARGFLRALFFLAITNGPGLLVSNAIAALNEDFAKEHPFVVLGSFYLIPVTVIAAVLSTMRARNGYRGPHEFLSGTRVIQLPWPARRRLYQPGTWRRDLLQPEGLPRQHGPFEIQGALRWTEQEGVLLGLDKTLGRNVWLWLRPRLHPGLSEGRHNLGRATRSRWLAGGYAGEFQWDAFLAPTGCSLREAVANSGRFDWTDSRPILEELAGELTAAVADGSLPESASVDQVWIQAHGRVLLLDFSLADTAIPRQDGPVEHAALALLGQVAALILEGQPRAAVAAPAPLRAPLPLHVSRFLPRLLGWPKPYHEVKEFQADLQASDARPTAVGRWRRAGHLVLMSFFLLMGCGCWLMPWFSSPRSQFVDRLDLALRDTERILSGLDDQARLPGDENGKELAALRGRLKEKQADLESESDAWAGTLSWLQTKRINLAKSAATIAPNPPPKRNPVELRLDAEMVLSRDIQGNIAAESMTVMALAGICLMPGLWIIWAFLFRGGFGYHLTGMRLVRHDGRKAARWQCAARSILFWLPVLLLMAGSIGLDFWFWSLDGPHADGVYAWLPQLSTVTWLAGMLLLPCYAVLALRSPVRSLHDRMVGTYLVPR